MNGNYWVSRNSLSAVPSPHSSRKKFSLLPGRLFEISAAPPKHSLRNPERCRISSAMCGEEMPKTKSGSSRESSPHPVTRRRRIWAALCLGIGIVTAGYYLGLQIQTKTQEEKVRLSRPLPAMIVEAAGAEIDLKRFIQGLRCVIVFHSPSCRICKEMLPALRPFPSGLRLILVNESQNQDSAAISDFPGASVFQDRHRILSRYFGITPLPVMLFVDESGVLRNGLAGQHSWNYVREQIKNFASDHSQASGSNP